MRGSTMENYKEMIMELLDEIDNENFMKYLYVLIREMITRK